MHSTVHLSNGCSASLVSSSGLVLTANHCVSDCVQRLHDTSQNNYVDGFVAAGRPEPRCEGLTAEVLSTVTDVTAQIATAARGLPPALEGPARQRIMSQLERGHCPTSDLASRCQVIAFFGGSQYKLFKYRVFNQVGLVFSPGVAASAYGPEVDPPLKFDVAFLRLRAGDGQAPTSDHLAWSASTPKVDDLVFIAGSPRISERQLTMSQLETERSFSLPHELLESAELKGRLVRFRDESAANENSSRFQLDDLSNHYKYILTLLDTLNEADVWAKKAAEEAALRAETGAATKAQFAIIDRAEGRRRELARARDSLDGGPSLEGAPSSELFAYARTLVEGAFERAKPSADRLPRYADARLPAVERGLLENGDVHRPLEELQLEAWFSRARDYAPPADPTAKLLLNDQTPKALAHALSQSNLNDVKLRREVWAGGVEAVTASTDPMIRYVLRLEPAVQAIRAKWKEEVVEPEGRAAEVIGRVRLAAYGADAYPDANRTLRISFGTIKGVLGQTSYGKPFTTVGDLYGFAAANPAYPLSAKWLEAEGQLSPATVMDMLSTNDTINGNSGSPLLNSRAEVVGVFGGGNAAAESGDYVYNARTNRAYSLSATLITQALSKVYGADLLVKELAAGSNLSR